MDRTNFDRDFVLKWFVPLLLNIGMHVSFLELLSSPSPSPPSFPLSIYHHQKTWVFLVTEVGRAPETTSDEQGLQVSGSQPSVALDVLPCQT